MGFNDDLGGFQAAMISYMEAAKKSGFKVA